MCEQKCDTKSPETLIIEDCIRILKTCTSKIRVCDKCGKQKPNKDEANLKDIMQKLQWLDEKLLMQREG